MGNLGDEAIFKGLLTKYDDVCQIYINVPTHGNAIEIGKIKKSGFPVTSCNLIIGGGGIFFKDSVDNLLELAQQAVDSGIDVEIQGVGAEAIQDSFAKQVLTLCNLCSVVTVRSMKSKSILDGLGVKNVEYQIDFAYYLEHKQVPLPSFDEDLPIIGVATAGNHDVEYTTYIVRELIASNKYNVLHLPHVRHHVNHHENEIITGEMIWSSVELWGRLHRFKLLPWPASPEELLGAYSAIDGVVGYRYHSFIFAEMTKTPLFGLPHGDKALSYFVEHPDMVNSTMFEDTSKENIAKTIIEFFAREGVMGETKMASTRRHRSFFFEKYLQGRGIDIGCGTDKILPDADGLDTNTKIPGVFYGDAALLKDIPDKTYDYVYSSHCLEDVKDVKVALRNWYRVLKTGGYLILLLPHRDYYERKQRLPSDGNPGHKHFFLPFISDYPHTISVHELITSTLSKANIVYLNECCDCVLPYRQLSCEEKDEVYGVWHGKGEHSIEVVIQKGRYTPIYEFKR